MSDRTVTYPLDAVRDLADRLQDLNWSMAADDAAEIARDIVIDVTLAVDRLRRIESSTSPARKAA